MVNSINSFYANNPKSLTDTITVFILTDKKEGLDLSKLNPNVKGDVIVIEESEFSYDYSTLNQNLLNPHITYHTYFRFEVFVNPIFNEYDNLLYLDCDTEVVDDISEIFTQSDDAVIRMVTENSDWLKIHHGIECPFYSNAGVILLTPKALGLKNSNELFNELIVSAKTNKFVYADQDALNYVLTLKQFSSFREILDEKYNSFIGTSKSKQNIEKPKIIHHAGNRGAKLYPLRYIV